MVGGWVGGWEGGVPPYLMPAALFSWGIGRVISQVQALMECAHLPPNLMMPAALMTCAHLPP